MAERFNLTAQIQLQAPTNTRQVIGQIRNQLQGITANVNVQANQKAINQANQGYKAPLKMLGLLPQVSVLLIKIFLMQLEGLVLSL